MAQQIKRQICWAKAQPAIGEAMFWVFCLFLFTLSCALTGLQRRYALATNMLDIPNHRSSHVAPTPRGGGVAFVGCFLVALVVLVYCKLIATSIFVALAVAGLFIAILGYLDDRGHIPARWRLLSHFVACSFALFVLGGMPSIPVFAWTLSTGLMANVLAVFYLVWLLNLYNFMDGIDGIAAVEAISVCVGGVLLYCFDYYFSAVFIPLSLGCVVAGFLFWNFPPAKIFMGDVGSGFLGLVLGILSIEAATMNPNFFWSWLTLLGVFIVDATVTLLVRGIRGEVLSEAHRSHAYQHASRYFGNHLRVTLGILAINMLWLLPLAIAIGIGAISGGLGLVIAYLPLIVLAWKFNAGQKE